jgi:hypothetical protein
MRSAAYGKGRKRGTGGPVTLAGGGSHEKGRGREERGRRKVEGGRRKGGGYIVLIITGK